MREKKDLENNLKAKKNNPIQSSNFFFMQNDKKKNFSTLNFYVYGQSQCDVCYNYILKTVGKCLRIL
jgi:hypothetical protein